MLSNKKSYLTFFFLCFTLCTSSYFAQKTPKAIKENRKKALDAFQGEHFELFRVEEVVGEKKWSYFGPVEKEWVYLINHEFDSLIQVIHRNEEFLSAIELKREAYFQDIPDPYKRVEPPIQDRLHKLLSEELKTKRREISKAIRESKLSEDDKIFLAYYLAYSIYQTDVCDEEAQLESVEKGDVYQQQFPGGKWNGFIKKYSPYLKAWEDSGLEYLLVVNNNRMMSDLGEHLNNGLSIGAQVGYTNQRFYLNGGISAGRTRVLNPFFHHITMEEFRRISVVSSNLTVGYHALLEKKWTITPIVGTQLNLLRGMPFPYESADAVNLRPIFGIGPAFGMHIDFNAPKASCTTTGGSFLYQRQKGRTFRLKIALSYPNFSRVVEELNGGMLQIGLAYGIYQPSIKPKEMIK